MSLEPNSTPIGLAIANTLLYFSIFDYPLNKHEIHTFCREELSEQNLEEELDKLIASQLIIKQGTLYSINKQWSEFQKREKANIQAQKLLHKGYKLSKLIGLFPFVKGVAISGSLSKGVAKPNDDIDYFIITKNNRLWIAHFTLHVLKKIYGLFGKERMLCLNFFIDEKHLEIEEESVFTATEILTLIPTYNPSAIADFIRANPWVYHVFPNFDVENLNNYQQEKKFWLSMLGEKILELGFLNFWNEKIKNVIQNRYRIKSKNPKDRINNIFISLYRIQPLNFSQRIVDLYTQKTAQFKTLWKATEVKQY